MKPFPPKTPWADLYVRSGLKTLSDKVRHQDVVQKVRTAVDDLRTTVRNTARQKLPEAMATAERFVRQVLAGDNQSSRAVVNATGLIAPQGYSLPLADPAIAAMARAAESLTKPSSTVEALLTEATGAEAALVLNSPAAALMAAIGGISQCGLVAVPKSQSCRVGGTTLRQLAESAGAAVDEFGTVESWTSEECTTALNGEGAAIVVQCLGLDYEVQTAGDSPRSAELFALAHKHGKPSLAYLATARTLDFEMFQAGDAPPKVQEVVAEGADLVVLPGDRFLGGPACGILVGKKQWIERIAGHAIAQAGRADHLTLAALEATLKLLRDPATTNMVPVVQLLSASLDNLKHRAQRIAAQLAVCNVVESAVAEEWPSLWHETRLPSRLAAGWSVLVSPKATSACELAARLKDLSPSILCRVNTEETLVWLNLRSVLPRQDEQIVAAFRSLGVAEQVDQPAAG